ncbi:MAG: Ig-like domain-containing protein [Bryobacteraceae bacterium]
MRRHRFFALTFLTAVSVATLALTALPARAAVVISLSTTANTLQGGGTAALTALVTGTSNTSVTWSLSPAVGSLASTNGATGSGGITTNLYTAPANIATAQTVTITATSAADTTQSASVAIQLNPSTPSIAISPGTVSLTNSQTQQFKATVLNLAVTTVTWSINPQVGSISSGGLYTAPALIGSTTTVTVTATSTVLSTVTGTATVSLNTILSVGVGAPTGYLQEQFVNAYQRGNFASLVNLPPLTGVTALGSSGYIQTFQSATNSSNKLALATASSTTATSSVSVAQIWADIYSYFSSLGVSTVGYPLGDTQGCPAASSGNLCTYQVFDKGYALFAYNPALAAGADFDITATFYTTWNTLGGNTNLGPPLSAATAIVASTSTTATVQTFAAGAIYNITSGTNKNAYFSVTEPLYDLYVNNGGPSGTLGLPTANAVALSSGGYSQTFEAGTLTTANGGTVLLPIVSVAIGGAPAGNTATLNVGQTLSLTATPYDTSGAVATGRAVTWGTSNGQVASVTASGASAVITALSGGAATITATAGGVTSTAIRIIVNAVCCAVGEGAPTTVAAAFQAALTRNHLVAATPVADAASRAGSGYVQTVTAGGASYLLAMADGASTAYVVSGALLAAYLALGGPAGPVGYPASDATAGGRQMFADGALAGNPVQLVSGNVLAKWAALGYETGSAGAPAGAAYSFTTFTGSSGAAQSFANGSIYASTGGPTSGQSWFVTGLILAAYTANGGIGGNFGMPLGDQAASGGLTQQNFEGGAIGYASGAAAATAKASASVPTAAVYPATVTAGSSALIAIYGFSPSSAVTVSVTGAASFSFTSANGAYSWSQFVAPAAASGSITITARQASSSASATLTVKALAASGAYFTKTGGDNQSGLPGALLPLPLVVALTDSSGSPVANAAVTFQASPGAAVTVASAVTDSNGHASTYLRLPSAAGIALVTANAPAATQTPVTFGATARAATLSNFPALTEAGTAALGNGSATIAQQGALLTAVASIFSYYQNLGQISVSGGSATPAALNQFLASYCSVDAGGNSDCDGFLSGSPAGQQVVNPWRAAQFAGMDVTVETPSLAAIADCLGVGAPVLVSLGLSLNGAAVGGNFVVATGVAADGSIVIQDPNPAFAISNLNSYLNGFAGPGGAWKGTILGVAKFTTTAPSSRRFMAGAVSQPQAVMQAFALDVISPSGACGQALTLWDTVDSSGNAPAAGALVTRLLVCDGLLPQYQVDIGAAAAFQAFVTDLAQQGGVYNVSGNSPASYSATRPTLNLVVGPETAAIGASGVVNAASFTAGIAPGGLVAVFGSGLYGAAAATTLSFDGIAAAVLAATPFQVNAQIPATITPGVHTLVVSSAYGSAQAPVVVSSVAPAIFMLSDTQGAIENQDGSINSVANPLPRGQTLVAYVTGLGATAAQGTLAPAVTPVTALLNGVPISPAYAGLTPGYVGLYQVNILIPANTPPGAGISLALQQGTVESNTVSVAIQ